ncbi:MAG TPA: sulfate ABC transporter substrate-binding protein [Candidatus Competibacteraceae bacterium]|nr:sulfate ABC transporter substrate-binding protein [Candidatus Competibacteraceae bacterium]
MTRLIRTLTALGLTLGLTTTPALAQEALLNASYDVAREFYKDYNEAFAKHWQAQTGKAVTLNQSHGASSKQARAIVDGLEADVATMNQQTDIELLADNGLVSPQWRSQFPHNASPYTSTIIFLVRKGNPKGIKDWDDLVKDGVQVIIPNPKTAGNGRYSYLAAWAYAEEKLGGADQAREFVAKLFKNVPVLDAGGRAATTTFIQRQIGDVLLTFESEVQQISQQFEPGAYEVVYPSQSILAENPVAVVDKVVDKKGTRELATAYLQYLFSPEGQRIAARHFLRPAVPEIAAEFKQQFPEIRLITVDERFGGWKQALKTHFADGGVFDQIYTPGR